MKTKFFKDENPIFGMRSHEITAAATLAAISAAFQLVHPFTGWQSPWGMWIDVVAIPWIIAYFLFGGRPAIVVSIVGALIITMVAPSTWLGALMKWLATVPMIIIPWLMQNLMK